MRLKPGAGVIWWSAGGALVSAVWLLLLPACGGSDSSAPDAARLDARWQDAARDALREDQGRDTLPPDTSAPDAPQDAAADAPQDAVPDTPRDAAADAPRDSALDAAWDSAADMLQDAPVADGPAPGCTTHCDCQQGWFCYKGTCVQDPKMAVYCCAKPGCPPGKVCMDLAGQKSTCAEDETFACQNACDCGPAHCCIDVPALGGKRCVKDLNDPWLPGGMAVGGASCNVGVDPTYCCPDFSCHEGRAVYDAQAKLPFFTCFNPATGQADSSCGGKPCFGTACNCEPGEVCVDTATKPGPLPGNTCHLASGGACVSGAAAEVVFGWPTADLLPCCSASCAVGTKCDAGWKRAGGRYAFQRVVASCGPCADARHHSCGLCGNGTCDPGEYPGTCPQDCFCGDGVCAPAEVGGCPADCGTCGDGTCDPGESPTSCAADCSSCGDTWCTASEVGTCVGDCWGLCRDASTYPKSYRVCGDGQFPGCGVDVKTCANCPQDCDPLWSWVPVHRGQFGWTPSTWERLLGIWGSGPDNVFAVGEYGKILRFDGTSWSPMTSGTTRTLSGVWGSSATSVFAVGSSGTILRFDGTSWSPMTSGTTAWLRGVWGSSATNVFAVGDSGTILRFDGTSWSPMASGTTSALRGVWGSSATNVFAVGDSGTILRFDGTSWSPMTSGTTSTLNAVWGSSATNVFAVGGTYNSGIILRFDGTSWSAMTSATTDELKGVWGSGPDNVFAVGGTYNSGIILRFDGTSWSAVTPNDQPPPDYNRTYRAVWGSSATSVFVVMDDETCSCSCSSKSTLIRFDGSCWQEPASLATDLRAVWGSAQDDVLVAGYGAVGHHDGQTWQPVLRAPVLDLWGSSATSVFAVGSSGTILRFDGTSWSPMTSGTTASLNGVWGSSATNVFAVGSSGTILRFDGTSWTPMSSGTTSTLYGVWGSSATNVFAVGGSYNSSIILRFDGTSWSAMTSGTTSALNAVWGSSATNVFAVGSSGTILRFDGTSWSAMTSGTTRTLNAVWGNSATNVFAVGSSGTILRFDGAGWSPVNVDLGGGACPYLYGIGGTMTGQGYIVGAAGLILEHCPQGCPAPPVASAVEAYVCMPAPPPPQCPNGTCDVGESCDGRSGTLSCPADCPSGFLGHPTKEYCFVDGACVGPGCP